MKCRIDVPEMPFRNDIDLKGVSQTDIYMTIERLWDSKTSRYDSVRNERMKKRERKKICVCMCDIESKSDFQDYRSAENVRECIIILNLASFAKSSGAFSFAKIFLSHLRCYVMNLNPRKFISNWFFHLSEHSEKTHNVSSTKTEIFAKLMIFLSPFPNTYIVLSIICLCSLDNVKCKSNEKIFLDNYISLTSIRTRFARQMWDDVSYKSTGPLHSYNLLIYLL